jgi:molybdopterin synthase sulfur carrier subunit
MLEMNIKIKYFGLLAEAMNEEEATINLKENCTVEELRKTLLILYPTLEGKAFKVAVNKNIVTEKVVILATDELALLPPFAGG